MSYQACARLKPQCKGLGTGVKGYHACVKASGCKTMTAKQKKDTAANSRRIKKMFPKRVAALAAEKKALRQKNKDASAHVKAAKAAARAEVAAQKAAAKAARAAKAAARPIRAKAPVRKVARTKSPWLMHVAAFRKANPAITKGVLKLAAASYVRP